jgi:hypothetical protein
VVVGVSRLEDRDPPKDLQLIAESPEVGLWRMYAAGDGYAIRDRVLAPNPPTAYERWSLFDASFEQGQVHLPFTALEARGLFPLHYHLDLLLVANHLARREGMLLHASAVRDGEWGYVFCGPSGAGKSTLARLYRDEGEGQVLNHDVVALRRGPDAGFWVHGTPWWTEDPGLCSPLGAPIRAIFFLAPGPRNQLSPLSRSEAALHLVAQCLSPVQYDAGLTAAMLGLCEALAYAVPAIRLEFRPEAEVIELIHALGD